MVLIIDNDGSFTYNLYHLAGTFIPDVHVMPGDSYKIRDIQTLRPSHIILSFGTNPPGDAGQCKDIILYFADNVPILGIGLGHQAIVKAFGGRLIPTDTVMHGRKNNIHIANGSPLFRGLPPLLEAGCYHALSADRGTLPEELLVIAETCHGDIMGIKHQDHDIFGLQFHPESILTPSGNRIMENFLSLPCGKQRYGGEQHD